MGFIARVNDRACTGRRGRNRLPHVVGPQREAENRPALAFENSPGPRDDLPRNEEWQQQCWQACEFAFALHEVVLVASEGIALRISIVFKQMNACVAAIGFQSRVGLVDEGVKLPLARALLGDNVPRVIAFRGRILGMGANVEIEPARVRQKHVRGTPPRDNRPEQFPRGGFRFEGLPPIGGYREKPKFCL